MNLLAIIIDYYNLYWIFNVMGRYRTSLQPYLSKKKPNPPAESENITYS